MFQRNNNIALSANINHIGGDVKHLADRANLFLRMAKICGIYKITNPKEKIYIGQSIDCRERLIKYKRGDCRFQTKLFNSIQKYGWDSHKFEIIHQCLPEELNTLEKYYVDLFQCFNSEYGLNLKEGGGSRGRMSEETKLKVSKSLKGRSVSISTRLKLSAALKGRKNKSGHKLSPEHREKIRISLLGNKRMVGYNVKSSTKIKIGTYRKGRKLSNESRKKLSENHSPNSGNKGRIFSEEHKRNLSQSIRNAYKSKRNGV